MTLLSTIRDFLDALLHSSARGDAMTVARHRAFIASRLVGSLTLLAAFPLYLAYRDAPTALEAVAFAWLIVPIGIAYYLSRTGRFDVAHALSAVALTGVVALVALATGGIESFAAVWFIAIPIEAAISASRRAVAFAVALSVGAVALLIAAGAAGALPPSIVPEGYATLLHAFGMVSATLYCATLAFVAENLSRTNVSLLSAEEDRYRLLAHHMSDVISRHDASGAVAFVSSAAATLFNAPAARLLGHGLFDRVHVADRPAYLTALSDAARGGVARSVEFRVRRDARVGEAPAGDFVWVEMRCRPMERPNGAPPVSGSEVVAVMRDIGERKAQEHALETARAEADRANDTRSRFLATMSHELRTPLNAVIGFSEMIAREDELGLNAARRKEYAQLINGSGQHLLSVVNDILDMSKMESGTFEICPEPFMPREAIANCCNLMALKAREGGIDIVVRAPDDLPQMIGDQRALKQILLNLLSNAIKFTERGGAITVSAAVEGPTLALRVADTGVGIASEDLKRLGDPFFQAGKTYQRRHEGTGLGLSIVKALVALHRGEMTVQSRIDEGTTVCIVLPLDVESVQRRQPPVVTTLPPRAAETADITLLQVKRSA